MKKYQGLRGLLVAVALLVALGGQASALNATTERHFKDVTLTTGTTTATLALDDAWGTIPQIAIIAPDQTPSTGTATVAFRDVAGITLYTTSAQAESTTTLVRLSEPITIAGDWSVLITSSVAMSVPATFRVVYWLRRP